MGIAITDLTGAKTTMEDINKSKRQEELDEVFINKSQLKENVQYTKVAYIHKMTLATSSIDSTYVKVILKDRNGNSISGVMFGLDSSNNTLGKTVLNLQGKVARVEFEAQDYEGSISLKITELSEYPEDMITVDEFFNPIKHLDEMFTYIKNKLDSLDDIYKPVYVVIRRASILEQLKKFPIDLWYSRKGGALKLAYKMIKYFESLELSEDGNKLLEDRLIALTVITLYQQSIRESQVDIIENKFNLDMGTERIIKINNNFWKIVVDSYNAKPDLYPSDFINSLEQEGKHVFYTCLGLQEPKTLTAKLITKQMREVRDTLALIETYSDMLNDTYTYVNKELLVKLGGI